MLALAQSNLSYDFEAFNAAGAVWNGAAFVTYAVADYASYRIAATKQGNANDEDIKAWFYADDVSGAVRWQMRERGASLALSPIVYTGPDVDETTNAGALSAERLRRFFMNRREPVSGAATGWQRFAVYENDGVTIAEYLDWNRSTGAIAPVS